MDRLIGIVRKVAKLEHSLVDYLHLQELKNLSLVRKLAHCKTRRHLAGLSLGAGLMLTGSWTALNAHWFQEHVPCVPHLLVDVVAYLIHGIGSIPVIGHAERIFRIFMD